MASSRVRFLSPGRWRPTGFSAALVGALSYTPFPGGETAAVVIEYRGLSNESVAPIVLTSPGSPADPDPGAAAHDGETWANVLLDSILRTGRACPDSIARQ